LWKGGYEGERRELPPQGMRGIGRGGIGLGRGSGRTKKG